MSICDACETVAHCSKHGCIPKSQHPAMAEMIAEIERNLAPQRDDEMSIAAVWTMALIAGLLFVGLGFLIVWMIFGG